MDEQERILLQQAYQNAHSQPFTKEVVWQAELHRKIGDTLVPQYHYQDAFDSYYRAEKVLGSQPENRSLAEQQEWLNVQLAISQLLYQEQCWSKMESIHEKIQSLILIIHENRRMTYNQNHTAFISQ